MKYVVAILVPVLMTLTYCLTGHVLTAFDAALIGCAGSSTVLAIWK